MAWVSSMRPLSGPFSYLAPVLSAPPSAARLPSFKLFHTLAGGGRNAPVCPQPKEASMEGDIVERLRWESNGVTVNLNPWPTMREAADAIALCRARVAELEDGR